MNNIIYHFLFTNMTAFINCINQFFSHLFLCITMINSIQFIQIKLEYNTNNNKDPGSELVEDHNHKKLKMKKREKKEKRKHG